MRRHTQKLKYSTLSAAGCICAALARKRATMHPRNRREIHSGANLILHRRSAKAVISKIHQNNGRIASHGASQKPSRDSFGSKFHFTSPVSSGRTVSHRASQKPSRDSLGSKVNFTSPVSNGGHYNCRMARHGTSNKPPRDLFGNKFNYTSPIRTCRFNPI